MNNSGRILVVVDMQKDFIDGALGTAEAVAIVPAVCAKIREARAAGDCVLATLDTHDEDYLQTREGRFLPVTHCVKDTPGWRLDAAVAEALDGAPTLEKPSFGSPALPETLTALCGVDGDGAGWTLELVGLCTDICVVSNALLLKAAFPEADMLVDAACCAGVTPESHRAALQTMRMCQISVMNEEG